MSHQILTRTFTASGAIGARRIVKFLASGTVDGLATLAAAATDLMVGVSERIDVADGDPVDIVLVGETPIVAGGTIARGQDVTSDAAGAAVVCTPAAGAAKRKIGVAMASCVVGDHVPVLLGAGQITTPV